ncbi:MAG: deoxyguanosinetriphosphate triphosphohydrolase [Actinobacteria bacterium]|nr:MAG: deoxyguanosinetriphosphate triphosphohydrolase [Actinomycetota bacterium]
MSDSPSIRERIERQEEAWLAPEAVRASETRGRARPMPPDDLRTEFQRDRDRIIHSKAFRRLKHKTQVFLSPEGDHYRTRLTHTIEVSQISRTIARALRLNEDLAEAIALAHDLGHTPFGHSGETALTESLESVRKAYPNVTMPFRHNEQSLRVVDLIEYDGKGLNLTWEVRDGIRHHTGKQDPATLEGQIVKIADRVAYVNHDVDDAIRAGVIGADSVPPNIVESLGRHESLRIGTLARDMVYTSADLTRIRLSEEKARAMNDLRQFLFENVYENPYAKGEEPKARRVLRALFDHYMEHEDELPAEFRPRVPSELPLRVCDYVAGMTDRYAVKTYEELFVPRPWIR